MSALSERLASLPDQHRQALQWFLDRRGKLIGWPEPLNGLFLVNPLKGIQKPKGWTHALSVRQSLASSYADQPPDGPIDGAWVYKYFQESKNPDQRDKQPTNVALSACETDDVPVAVLIQEKVRGKVQYRVWGLAKVVGWHEG